MYGKEPQFTHVDYCNIQITREGCTFVMTTATQADKQHATINGLSLVPRYEETMLTTLPTSGHKLALSEMSDWVKKNVDPKMKISVDTAKDINQWDQSISVASIKFMSGNTPMQIDCGPEMFVVVSVASRQPCVLSR